MHVRSQEMFCQGFRGFHAKDLTSNYFSNFNGHCLRELTDQPLVSLPTDWLCQYFSPHTFTAATVVLPAIHDRYTFLKGHYYCNVEPVYTFYLVLERSRRYQSPWLQRIPLCYQGFLARTSIASILCSCPCEIYYPAYLSR